MYLRRVKHTLDLEKKMILKDPYLGKIIWKK